MRERCFAIQKEYCYICSGHILESFQASREVDIPWGCDKCADLCLETVGRDGRGTHCSMDAGETVVSTVSFRC